jgi:two-component system NtrC family sensor kinase
VGNDRTRSREDAPNSAHADSAAAPSPSEGLELAQRFHTDRLVTLGHLAARAAHDINGQLMAAHHNLDISLHIARALQAQPALDADVARLVDALTGAGYATGQIAAITRDMTLYARSPSTRLEPVDVHAVVRDALRITSGLLRDKARVIERLQPVPALRGRPSLLVQLLVNLLINALQALTAGGTEDATIVLETSTGPNELRLVVRDNGPGVPPELRARIFEPFFTTKPAGLGTGLGLAICREIAEQHGGNISLASGSEPGARFELLLPLRGPGASEAPAASVR